MEYKIALFPGDGVGPELVNEGIKVLEKAAELDKFRLDFIRFPNCAEHYMETNTLLDEKSLVEIGKCSAIYCGTFGLPEVAPSVLEEGFLGKIKGHFDQFAFLKPIRLYPNIEGLIKGKSHNDVNFAIMRENSEEFSQSLGSHAKIGKGRQQFELDGLLRARLNLSFDSKAEFDYQIGVLSKKGCDRFSKFAFEYAKQKNIVRITSVDKLSHLNFYSAFRSSVSIASKESHIEAEFELIDSAVMNLVRQPEKYKLIVAPYLIGDVLCDLGNMIQGGLGFSHGGYINPQGISMFMPLHGSAPKLREKSIVNPAATILAGAMALDFIGQEESASLINKAVEAVFKDNKVKTQDLNGLNSTSEMGEAIVDKFVELHD